MDGASAAEKTAKMRKLRIRPVREVGRTQEFQSILHGTMTSPVEWLKIEIAPSGGISSTRRHIEQIVIATQGSV
jgi:hypothetical protein